MSIDFVDLNSCFNCDSGEVSTYHLLEWSSFKPDLVACCSEQNCMNNIHKLKAKVSDLTHQEAQLLLIKSRL
jgi:hypothetical protein